MYAVIKTGGKQYRVALGDTIAVERLEAEVGKPVTLDCVLFAEKDGRFAIGAPTVADARVTADVVEHFRDAKVVTFKMRRREGYHKTIGHRQEMTRLKISDIKV